jgi:hypothetical protein
MQQLYLYAVIALEVLPNRSKIVVQSNPPISLLNISIEPLLDIFVLARVKSVFVEHKLIVDIGQGPGPGS